MSDTIESEISDKHPEWAERAKTSRVMAVKLFCLACCGGERAAVRDCTATQCFLYRFRPYRPKP